VLAPAFEARSVKPVAPRATRPAWAGSCSWARS